MKYRVFISFKSEDIAMAKDVYEFLAKHIPSDSIFFSDESLKREGDVNYSRIINEALRDSLHLILVSSKMKYIYSKWVEHEWSTFSELKRKPYGDKFGNLIAILSSDFLEKLQLVTDPKEDLPTEFLKQRFDFNNYKETILNYLKEIIS